MAHVEEAAAGFADDGEGLDQEVVEGGALGDLFLEFDGLGGEVDIGQLADGRLELVDGRHDGPHAFDLALGLGAEDFRQDGIDNHEWSRYGGSPQFLFYSVRDDGGWKAGLAEAHRRGAEME